MLTVGKWERESEKRAREFPSIFHSLWVFGENITFFRCLFLALSKEERRQQQQHFLIVLSHSFILSHSFLLSFFFSADGNHAIMRSHFHHCHFNTRRRRRLFACSFSASLFSFPGLTHTFFSICDNLFSLLSFCLSVLLFC